MTGKPLSYFIHLRADARTCQIFLSWFSSAMSAAGRPSSQNIQLSAFWGRRIQVPRLLPLSWI